jgi:hypothetical protein
MVALFETHHAQTSSLAPLERADVSLRRADQLAEPVLSLVEGLKQGLSTDKSVLLAKRQALNYEKRACAAPHMYGQGTIYSV